MNQPTCINLQAEYGRRYRIDLDESYWADRSTRAGDPDPWLQQIRCRFGHIFPHGGTILAASVDEGHGKLGGQLKRLACCTVHQDGDDGVTVLFDQADFAQVAAVMQPYRRKQVSEQELERLRAMSAAHGFKAKGGISEGDLGAQGSVPEGQDGILHQPSGFEGI